MELIMAQGKAAVAPAPGMDDDARGHDVIIPMTVLMEIFLQATTIENVVTERQIVIPVYIHESFWMHINERMILV